MIENRTLFHNDNLPVMRGLPSESVDLVYFDPPWNKNKDFHATPDSLSAGAKFVDRWSWENDVHDEWVEALLPDHEKLYQAIMAAYDIHSPSMGAYIAWAGARALEAHRLLKTTGSFYYHCDSTASAYIKQMLDAVFDEKNFRNEISWCYTGPSNTKRWFPRKHDTLLYYVKSDAAPFNKDSVRIPYSESFTSRRKYAEGSSIIAFQSTGRTEHEVIESYGTGKVVEDWWSDIPSGGQIPASERTGYPTQKSIALLERIIKASSKPGDMILDPHCGCATACIAAERLGRRWVGIDIWDGAHDLVVQRLEKECEGLFGGSVHYRTDIPDLRGEDVASTPQLAQVYQAIKPASMKRDEMMRVLTDQWGMRCWGCGFEAPHIGFLQLDHNLPQSEGGDHELDNRAPMCGPCNMRKSNAMTVTQLRRDNKKDGIWYGSPEIDDVINLRAARQWAKDYLLQ